MGDDLEQALKGKTLADIIHALPCDHPIQIEIDRLKGELEDTIKYCKPYCGNPRVCAGMQAHKDLERQLAEARAEVDKLRAKIEADDYEMELASAHQAGWEQAKVKAFEIARNTQIGKIQTTIAAMEYKEDMAVWQLCVTSDYNRPATETY